MKLIAKRMLNINRKLYKAGESFEAPKSLALTLIKQELATKGKIEKAVIVTEENEMIDSYEDMTNKELKQELETRGAEIPKKANKKELIALLKKA